MEWLGWGLFGRFRAVPPHRHCERSEAIHLATERKNGLLRRFASRNDGELQRQSNLNQQTQLHDLAARFARGLLLNFLTLQRGRRECRVHAAPAVSCAKMCKKAHTSIQVQRRHPTFPAQWFYGLCRALPGGPGLLSPSPVRSLLLTNLTPASGRQNHTILPYASVPFVKGTSASTASHPASVTIAKRPSYRDGTKSIYC